MVAPLVPCELSLVVPAYNEQSRLPALLEALEQRTDLSQNPAVEVIVVDDGSTDDTVQVARSLLQGFIRSTLVEQGTNLGKGAALRRGVHEARGAQVLFMDADLATNLDNIADLRRSLHNHHLAVGSRSVSGSVVHNGQRYRRWMGIAYNALLRSSTNVTVSDSQCGFKAFRGPVAKLLFHCSHLDGFGQDAELLDMAAQLGFTTAEVPVEWTNVAGTKVSPLSDSWATAVEVARHRKRKLQQETLEVVRLADNGNDTIRCTDVGITTANGSWVAPMGNAAALALRLGAGADQVYKLTVAEVAKAIAG